ncbi:MAG: hypothetical protein DWH81_02360 [Planctomycetota bacterium]|jgi:hypothetical protein|nr:MAG: hypothetical protein DWH81_02360 [Planctomycetota bacterium]
MTRTRIEADREDLMAEAVNLRERIELKVPGIDHPVTIGCNDLGHWSFYFGPEPMCRFDSDAQLRRAVRGGQLYRTQGGTLAQLTRVRHEDVTNLERRDLSPTEVEAFLGLVAADLRHLNDEVIAGRCEVLREVGTSAEFIARLTSLLARLTSSPLKLAPALPTKRK